jgi:primosomal protein N' (replication factor Y)
MIAQVIVDVAAKQTDHFFEYEIPQDLDVQIGSRVVVPFGRRRVQGFVVGLSESSSYQNKLKPILTQMDQGPVLTPELVELSKDLANEIFAFRIAILKTMLPQVMRANYRKIWRPVTEDAKQLSIFKAGFLEWSNKVPTKVLTQLNKLQKQGAVKVEYLVENKASKKTSFAYSLTDEDYQELLKNTRANAKRQQAFLRFVLDNKNDFPMGAENLAQAGFETGFLAELVKKGWLKRQSVEVYRKVGESSYHDEVPHLTEEQEAALNKIVPAIEAKKNKTFLLEGVTGSGKTEVYLRAIAKALQLKKTALMLVPEISLTPQMVARVKARFGQDVAVLHSGLSAGEKYDEWRRIKRGEAQVVVGARSAVFAPLQKLGVIIIDEEHESSYKQEDTPRYHARSVALWRARYYNCPLILGSATPSLSSRARAQKHRYELLMMPTRATGSHLPQVQVLDLKKTRFAGSQFDLTTPLVEALQERLKRHEQSILLLNRRGFSSFMLCRECGFVLKCPNCDVSLTFHKAEHAMRCHYCGYSCPVPKRCPNCQSSKLRFLGTGTQKVEEELKELLPSARVLRMDVDTTRRKHSYQRILNAFGRGEADILLGTQMIAKGLDFPNVTLVGVIDADTALWLPDYHASEKTFQLLTQVAGRAGRAAKPGQVIIQTYNPDHYAIRLAAKQDYEAFYRREMFFRHEGNYPPYYYTVLISCASETEKNSAKTAFAIQRQLLAHLHKPTIVLGPTPAAISRVKRKYYYQILVKYKEELGLNQLLHSLQDQAQTLGRQGVDVYIDKNPERIL